MLDDQHGGEPVLIHRRWLDDPGAVEVETVFSIATVTGREGTKVVLEANQAIARHLGKRTIEAGPALVADAETNRIVADTVPVAVLRVLCV